MKNKKLFIKIICMYYERRNEMKKYFKKMVAVFSAIAIVVAGISIQHKAVSAVDYSGLIWKQVGTSDYYVAAANDEFGFQLLEDQTTQMLIIPLVAAGSKPIWPDFKDAAFEQPAGAGIYIKYDALNADIYNVFEATSAVDNHRFQIIIKKGTPSGGEGETTTGTDVPVETTTTAGAEVPVMVGNPLIQKNNFGNGDIVYVAGLDTITGAKTYNLYVDGNLWGVVTNGQNIPIDQFTPGSHLFQVTGVNDAGESAKSEGFTFEIPSVTPVATYSVTVNGTKVADVEEGKTYTLGDAKYGYYTDGKIYKAGTALTITGDISLTSIDNLSVNVANGAAVKTSTPAGLKFQANVSSNNAEAVKSDAIKEGMLITANDIFENNQSVLDITSAYTMLNIENTGWSNADTMTYYGAVANISEANYTRNFISRAYVTVTYTDGTSTTIYSGMSNTRSVSFVASAVKSAGYPNLTAAEIQVIDSFIR